MGLLLLERLAVAVGRIEVEWDRMIGVIGIR